MTSTLRVNFMHYVPFPARRLLLHQCSFTSYNLIDCDSKSSIQQCILGQVLLYPQSTSPGTCSSKTSPITSTLLSGLILCLSSSVCRKCRWMSMRSESLGNTRSTFPTGILHSLIMPAANTFCMIFNVRQWDFSV